MNKTADTKYSIHPLLAERWSPRSFDAQREISEQDIYGILESAAWAPSSMNEQPWRYYYAHRADEDSFKALWECLTEGNQVWAKDVSILMAVSMKKYFQRNGKVNRTAQHDVGLANAQLVLEALHRGIHAHMMGGFHDDKARSLLNLPEEEEVVCFVALGYKADPAHLADEKLQKREMAERSRLSIDSIATRL